MLIIDAMRRCNSSHEVCYLLTNYVETLQFHDVIQRLPGAIAALPLNGQDDIEARCLKLHNATSSGLSSLAASDSAILSEAADVFHEAKSRLRALNPAPARTTPPAYGVALPHNAAA